MPEPWQAVLLVLVGLAGGTAGGFLGIGGTVVFLPLMKLILDAGGGEPLDPHTAIAATLVVNVCVGASSTLAHVRAGRILPRIVRILVPASVAASVAGVAVGNLFSGDSRVWLWRLLGVLLTYVVGMNVYRLLRPAAAGDLAGGDFAGPPPKAWRVAIVGAMTGFASGLLGVGGGSVAVPAQQTLLGMRLRAAIANSAVTIIFSCLLAAILKNATLALHGESLARPWIFVALLAPTAIAGAFVGSHLVHRVPGQVVRLAFIAFLGWTAWEMLTA